MRSLAERLHEVHQRLNALVLRHKELRMQLAAAEARSTDLERVVDMLKARVSELERENEVLRTTRPAESRPEVPGTKEKIDALVHEIDRCLAMIHA